MGRADDADTPVVGLFHDVSPPVTRHTGIASATQGLVHALATHGQRFRYELCCDPRQRSLIERALPGPSSAARVSSRLDLPDRLDALAPAAWHDARFDTVRPFALRAQAAQPFPVTLSHHSLSYGELLHQAVLPLLLARPQGHDAIVCTSRAARTALERLFAHVTEGFRRDHGLDLSYGGRLDEIPLGVDTDRFAPGDPAAARARMGLSRSAFVMLWVGRLSPIDKADLLPLLHVLRRLVQETPQRELSLVLAGSQRPGEAFGDRLDARAEALGLARHVRVMKDVSDDDLPALYRAADVFVSPADSVQESFGLAPVEAMASGVPQVVSDWDGYRDTVVHGHTGLLVPTLWSEAARSIDQQALLADPALEHLRLAQSVVVEPAGLARSLRDLIDHPERRHAMGEASRGRALERHAWPVVVAQYEALWAELRERCAREAPVSASGGLSHLRPRHFDAFRGHASTLLEGHERVALTADGRRALSDGPPRPPLGSAFDYLDRELLARLLRQLDAADARKAEPSIDALARTVITEGGPSPEAVVLHLLWLAKYGLVELGS